MDVLSDAVGAMRVGRAHASRTRRDGPFTRHFAPSAGAGFHAVLDGSCRFVRADGSTLTLRAGELVLLPHGSAHGLADSTGSAGSATVLCGAYLLDRARAHPLLHTLPEVVHLSAPAPLWSAIRLLGAEADPFSGVPAGAPVPASPNRAGSSAMVQALLDVVLVETLRTWFAGGVHPAEMPTRDLEVGAALRAMHDAPARGWTVALLAREGGLSRAVFARRFTAAVGRTPLAYLTWWRMTLAARLLRSGEVPVGAVARQVGYATESAFAHAFKREYGTAPGAFRRAGAAAGAGVRVIM